MKTKYVANAADYIWRTDCFIYEFDGWVKVLRREIQNPPLFQKAKLSWGRERLEEHRNRRKEEATGASVEATGASGGFCDCCGPTQGCVVLWTCTRSASCCHTPALFPATGWRYFSCPQKSVSPDILEKTLFIQISSTRKFQPRFHLHCLCKDDHIRNLMDYFLDDCIITKQLLDF